MLDIKQIEKRYRIVKRNLRRRGYELTPEVVRLHRRVKDLMRQIEGLNKELNAGNGNAEMKKDLALLKDRLIVERGGLDEVMHMMPNLLAEGVPNGKGAEDNVETERHGRTDPREENYLEVGRRNGLNMEAGTVLAQARFNVMEGKVAKLHRRLINAALDFYEGRGYGMAYVPYMVNENTMFGTAQYPKFKDELFKTEDGLFMIPTGEVPLTNVMGMKLHKEAEAERNMMTHTPCFRREAGAAGRDMRGIIRQHQFEKVELVKVCLPENGEREFHRMVDDVRDFLTGLGITFRVVRLCAGDMGFAGHMAVDFEAWFGADEMWREVATLTWCGDFQARRMDARVKRKDGRKEYLHTLNGTGLAAGRVMACLLETFGEEAFERPLI